MIGKIVIPKHRQRPFWLIGATEDQPHCLDQSWFKWAYWSVPRPTFRNLGVESFPQFLRQFIDHRLQLLKKLGFIETGGRNLSKPLLCRKMSVPPRAKCLLLLGSA